MGFYMPPAAITPPVEETVGSPEHYIDGSVLVVDGNIVHIIGFVRRGHGEDTRCYETVRIHLSVKAMQESMFRCAAALIATGKH